MSNLTDLISAGGGGGSLPQIALTQSQTWVPPQDGNICIHVIAAGGGGHAHTSDGPYGGGAGGYCKKNSLAVTTSGSFTVVIGVGGLGGYTNGTYNGAAGGNSAFSGTGLSSTLNVDGGMYGTSSSGGAGGSAANGDVNNTGGAGSFYGGGAVGVYGTGNSGRDNAQGGAGGGSSDAQGWDGLTGYGQIVGGKGTKAMNFASYGLQPTHQAPALAGGGATFGNPGSGVKSGCDGGTGGGGGGCRNTSNMGMGGCGGDGIVIIQYLPA